MLRQKALRIDRRLGACSLLRQSLMDSYGVFSEWDITTIGVTLSVRLLLLGAITIYHLRQKHPCWRGLVESSGWEAQCPHEAQTGTSLSHATNGTCAPPSPRLTVNPAVVKRAAWLCILFGQLGRLAATEVGFPMTEVCRPPEREHNLEMLYKVFLLGLLAAGFLGGWLARSCCSCLAPLPPAAVTTPTQTAPTTGRPLRRTVSVQSQKTYKYSWQTPRFQVVHDAQQCAWAEELHFE